MNLLNIALENAQNARAKNGQVDTTTVPKSNPCVKLFSNHQSKWLHCELSQANCAEVVMRMLMRREVLNSCSAPALSAPDNLGLILVFTVW